MFVEYPASFLFYWGKLNTFGQNKGLNSINGFCVLKFVYIFYVCTLEPNH